MSWNICQRVTACNWKWVIPQSTVLILQVPHADTWWHYLCIVIKLLIGDVALGFPLCMASSLYLDPTNRIAALHFTVAARGCRVMPPELRSFCINCCQTSCCYIIEEDFVRVRIEFLQTTLWAVLLRAAFNLTRFFTPCVNEDSEGCKAVSVSPRPVFLEGIVSVSSVSEGMFQIWTFLSVLKR